MIFGSSNLWPFALLFLLCIFSKTEVQDVRAFQVQFFLSPFRFNLSLVPFILTFIMIFWFFGCKFVLLHILFNTIYLLDLRKGSRFSYWHRIDRKVTCSPQTLSDVKLIRWEFPSFPCVLGKTSLFSGYAFVWIDYSWLVVLCFNNKLYILS